MNRRHLVVSLLSACLVAPLPAMAQNQRADLSKDVAETIATMRKAEPGIEKFFKSAVGYAVFPRIGKGGFIIVGGHGDGELIEGGKAVGVASVTIGTVGFQAGAQSFSEIIFFQNKAALDRFKQGKFEVTAGVSVVILKAGVANSADYREGVIVVAHPRGGAMAETSIGAQKFKYKAGG